METIFFFNKKLCVVIVHTRWKSDILVVMIHFYHDPIVTRWFLTSFDFRRKKLALFFSYSIRFYSIWKTKSMIFTLTTQKESIFIYVVILWNESDRLFVTGHEMMIGHFLLWAIWILDRMQKNADRQQNKTHHCRFRFLMLWILGSAAQGYTQHVSTVIHLKHIHIHDLWSNEK